MSERFSENEILKSTKLIEKLFLEGKSVYFYPLKLIYIECEWKDASVKIGFGVSKKNFKRAVDRNLLKRRMREAYRKNKPQVSTKNYACMLIYSSKKIENYTFIQNQLKQCFNKSISREINN